MEFLGLSRQRRFQAGFVVLVLLFSGFAVLKMHEARVSDVEDRIVTGEDCDVPEKFDIGFGDLEYYPDNGTPRVEIVSTDNVTSEYLKNISLRVFGGDDSGYINPFVKAENRTSRSGLIATTEDGKTAVGDFPLQPMNITIQGLAEDMGEENFSGLGPGDQVQLRYHQQYVAVEDFCRYTEDVVLFKLDENEPEIKWSLGGKIKNMS